MREQLPHWDYVFAAYAIGLFAFAFLIAWSWQSMRRAEKRREGLNRR